MTIFRTFLIAIAMLTLCYCKSGNKERSILPDKASIKDGDIVLRKGTGFTSHAVAFADKSSDYSHCGIVMIKDGKPMVIHAVPDEPDFDGDKDRVKMEPLEKFFSSIRASKGRIMRSKMQTLHTRVPAPLRNCFKEVSSSTMTTTTETQRRCIAANSWNTPFPNTALSLPKEYATTSRSPA